MIKDAKSMNSDHAPSSVEEPTVTTFEINYAPDHGYRLKTAFEETMPQVPRQLPEMERWWCVIDGDGLGSIYGPYLTETAAQSLVAELGRGLVHQMTLK